MINGVFYIYEKPVQYKDSSDEKARGWAMGGRFENTKTSKRMRRLGRMRMSTLPEQPRLDGVEAE